jgi:hypothetical protein
MLELVVLESASVSVRRRSGTASMAIETVLATTALPTTTTSDHTLRRDMAGDRQLVYFQRC